jgi:hypothetical protein
MTAEGKQIPVGNGGVTDRYYWTQTLKELNVHISVAPGTRGKSLDVQLKGSGVSVKDKVSGRTLLEGEWEDTIRSEESMWNLDDDGSLLLTLEKSVPIWWKAVIKGDPEIDTTKVDSSRSVSDYDPETQGAIRKIMFDQKQKALGLPTSEDLTKDDLLLEQAKLAPGSPFL